MATKKNFSVNGHEYYRITRTIGHKIVDGKKIPIKKQFLGSSKRAADKEYEKWRDAQKQKTKHAVDDRTFGEIADYFEEHVLSVDSKYASTTRQRYSSAYRGHIKNTIIVDKPMTHVTSEDIQIMYNSMQVTKATIDAIHKFMVAFYKWLVRNNYTENLLAAVVIPEKKENKRTEDEEIIVWEDYEVKTIAENLGDHRLRFFVLLCLTTGLRISELIGLKYSDFSEEILHVDRQYCDGEFRPPKNKSYRDLPLHDMAKRELERHRTWHEKEMEKKKYKTDYVFTTVSGGMLDRANVRRSLNRFYKKHNIQLKKFHAYRATFCTNLCRAGVPIQTASKLMGHKSVEVTAKFYTAISTEEKKKAVNLLPDLTRES